MHDALLVRGFNGLGDLAGDSQGIRDRRPAVEEVREPESFSASVGPSTSSITSA
jgi:hypothetical protein